MRFMLVSAATGCRPNRTRLGATGTYHSAQRKRTCSDWTYGLRYASPSSTPCSPVGEKSVRGPAEPARVTEQQSKPDEPDAFRREGDLRDPNALTAALRRRSANRPTRGLLRRCFVQEPRSAIRQANVFFKSLSFAIIAICASLPVVMPARAQPPATGP